MKTDDAQILCAIKGVVRYALLACTLVACAGMPVPSAPNARVVDDSTHPHTGVPGVRLLFLFRGTEAIFPHSSDVCDAAASSVSDANGYFDLPARIGRRTQIVAYKRGYLMLPTREEKGRHEVLLIRSPGHDSSMTGFSELADQAHCVNVGADGAEIAKFFEAVLADAKAQASGDRDERVVRRLKDQVWAYQRNSN